MVKEGSIVFLTWERHIVVVLDRYMSDEEGNFWHTSNNDSFYDGFEDEYELICE